MTQEEEYLSKSEGLVKVNIERISETIIIELNNEDENSDLLEDDLQKELKDEITKIKLGMIQLIDHSQYDEKDTEMIERENVERIEIETEVEKLKQPQRDMEADETRKGSRKVKGKMKGNRARKIWAEVTEKVAEEENEGRVREA